MKRKGQNIRFILSTIFLLFVLLSITVKAQVVLDNAPHSVKWYQVNTDHFNVLFPENFDSEAMRMANTLEHLYIPVSKSLKIRPKKVDILFQNMNSIANGFVALAPRRSEFYTMSPQNYNFLGTNDWLDMLAVHEYRHVVQNDKSNVGFNRFVYWILGEYALSGMGFASVPNWFDEGDAVGMETVLTNSGRGRIPAFNMVMRSSFLEKGAFNYHKQYLRSFKDFVPTHYVLGYHYTTYLRRKTNKNIWEPITLNAYKKSFIPFNFSNSIKKYDGKRVVKTYNEMVLDITQKWQNQLDGVKLTSFERINKRNNSVFTDYNFPQVLPGGEVIALKNGLSHIETFVLLDQNGDERKVFQPGIVNNPGYISVGGGLILWTEYEFDPRWDKRSYSVVKTYDIYNKDLSVISKKSRYAGAVISPDGVRVAVIEYFPDGKYQLKVISANQGNSLKVFGVPSKELYSMPRWTNDSKSIVLLKHMPRNKSVVKIDYESGNEEVLIDYSEENVGHPVLNDHILFYNSPYSGIDNIYAMDLDNGKKYQVTSSKYGAFNPSVSTDGKTINYNDFTVNGMDVVKIPFDQRSWIPLEDVKVNRIEYYKPLIEQENNGNILETVPENKYIVKPYQRGKKLLNIHSWGPYFGTSVLNFEIGAFFQDVLSLNRGFLGYDYNLDEGTGKWKFDYSYQGFFPVIDFSVYTGNRKITQQTLEQTSDTTAVIRDVNYEWEEKGFSTGLRIPLKLTNSRFRTNLSIANYVSTNYVQNMRNDYQGDNNLLVDLLFDQQGNGTLLNNELNFSIFNLLKTAKRDIRSKWGQVLIINGLSTPYGGDFDAGLFAATSYLYFPGLFRHHSLNFLGAYQKRKITLSKENYWFQNRVPFPRGHSSSAWETFYTLRTNYEFTLWNADIALGPVLNIQRIRTRLFYDTGFGETDVTNSETSLRLQGDKRYRSYGGEIWFDFNVMRLQPLLNGGFRIVNVPGTGVKFEIVLGNIQI